MIRKRYSNGELESWNSYNRRVYCSKECLSKAYKEKPHTGTSWMTIHYHARNLLPEGPCEICGATENIDVHHKDLDPHNNDPSNLIRLCRSCHMKQHRVRNSCKICGKPVKGLGFCEKHYQRFKKYGDPMMTAYGPRP